MDAAPRLCVVGSANTDLIAYVPRLPLPGETLHGHDFRTGFGGKGANQAVMAARLGARVSMVAKLGRDGFGEATLANFRDQGIDTTYVLLDDHAPTGSALIFVNDVTGQNSIVVAAGANQRLTADEVRRASAVISAARVTLCQWESTREATLTAFRIARAAGVTTVFNPAPAPSMIDDALAFTDILIPNELEAQMLVGHPVESDRQLVDAARELQARGALTVLITLGERGALLIEGEAAPQRIAAETVQALDTTGAGDAFVGSFGYFLAEGRSVADAARRACAIATRSVLKPGTQTSFPYRAEVLDLLGE